MLQLRRDFSSLNGLTGVFARPYAGLLRALFVVALIVLAVAPAAAKCSVTVNASTNGTAVIGTATVSGNCGVSAVDVYLDGLGGPLIATSRCETPTCTVDFNWSGCLTPGPHLVGAYAGCRKMAADNSCVRDDEGGNAFAVVNIPPPAISLTYQVDELGNAEAHVPYTFSNADNRELFLSVNDGPLLSHRPPTPSGLWIARFSTACWRSGDYKLTATARQCGDETTKVSSDTAIAVNSKPSVAVSYTPPPPGGNATAIVDYAFPNTNSANQRLLGLQYGTGEIIDLESPAEGKGQWVVQLDTACMTGTHRLIASATSCGTHDPPYQDQAETTFSADSLPKVQVTLRREKGAIKGILSYDMGEGRNWNISATRLKWVLADGTIVEGARIFSETPKDRTGVRPFEITAAEIPNGARQLTVLGAAQTCKGRATSEASIECDCDMSNDPVYFVDGNVRVTDVDPLPPVADQRLVRTYDSDEQVIGLFGRGWTTLFERRLIVNTDGAEQIVSIVTDTNEVVTFRGASTFRQTWPTSKSRTGTLTLNAATGTYTHRPAASRDSALFRASDGRLIAVRDVASGREARVSYDAQGLPISLTDSWSGTTWNLTIANRRVTSIAVAGRSDLVWSYAYDASGNLLTVTAPSAATWRTYEYSNNRMTASRDALGNLIESHTYDANGYGISSTGPSDEIETIEYDLAGSVPDERITRVTYKTGATADYALRPSGGAYRSVRITGGCGTCGAHDVTYVRDERGRIIREQDARGYVTDHEYDSRTHHLVMKSTFRQPPGCDPTTDAGGCRMTADDLARPLLVQLAPTRSTLTTRYEYGDANWPDRPTAIRTETIVIVLSRRGQPASTFENDGLSRLETFTYHSVTGDVLAHSVSGWTADQFETRTTTTSLYDGQEGAAFDPGGTFQGAWLTLPQPVHLRKKVDGPRTNVEDATLFVYYPVDQAVPAELRGRLAAVKNAAGHMVKYAAYDIFGNVTRIVDANDVVTESAYDALGRITTTTIKGISGCDTAADPHCATDLTHRRTYFPAGPLKSEQRPGGGVTLYAYDSRGRVKSVSRGPAVDDQRERIEYTYDLATGKKSAESTQAFENAAWVEKLRQSFAYNTHGLLTKVTHLDGAFIEYTYDAAHQLSGVRDENHSAVTGAPFNTRYSYSPSGLLEKVMQKLSGAPDGEIVTSYGYDMRGNLTGVVDPNGNSTQYFYDDFDQLYRTISPVTGTTDYDYDDAGQLISVTDANGATTTRTYDALGRVLKATSTRDGSTEVVTWVYDTGTLGASRLSSMTDPAGSTAYAYERRGLLREETRSFPNAAYTYTTGFRYDVDGNRTRIVYPSTKLTVDYTYDYAGRPTSASGVIVGADYLPFGPMRRLQFANGTTQSFAYDNRYRMTENKLADDDAPPSARDLAKYTYAYDAVGNVTSINDVLDNGYSRHFGYDELHRLAKANTREENNPNAPPTALWGKGRMFGMRWEISSPTSWGRSGVTMMRHS